MVKEENVQCSMFNFQCSFEEREPAVAKAMAGKECKIEKIKG